MKRFTKNKKVLFGLAVSLVLALAIGSLALVDNQTPSSPQASDVVGAVNAPESGPFTVTGTSGQELTENDYSYANGVLTIKSTTPMTIKNTNAASTTDRIVIGSGSLQAGNTVNLTLAGVNIATGSVSAMTIQDNATFNVTITLADNSENTLSTSATSYTGLQKSGSGEGIGTLTIQGGSAGNGTLKATGGSAGAGIGSYNGHAASNIVINGGKVTATGGAFGAGIGSGASKNATNITINGGEVKAQGGAYASGIGGGVNKGGSHITITGGKVEATGGYEGAGIGSGGKNGGTTEDGSNITISGGEVKATGGYGGAGIGGGMGGSGHEITISGGEVKATGGDYGAGIGGGTYKGGSGITISGGAVTATATYAAAGIGGGWDGSGTEITISGGTVSAIGAGSGHGIGGGHGASGSNNKLDGNVLVVTNSIQGFDEASGGSLTKGIIFIGSAGTMYGNVDLESSVAFPAKSTFAIGEAQTLTVKNGVTLTVSDGATLTNKGTLTVNGTIACEGSGKVTAEVNYEANGGDPAPATEEKTYLDNGGYKTYGTLPAPEKTGYTLDGWYTQDGGQGSKVEESTNVDVNLHNLYANWDVNYYTVTFDSRGGTAVDSQSVSYEGTVERPADPTRGQYHIFGGWYKESRCEHEWDFDNDKVTGDITLYAKWTCDEPLVVTGGTEDTDYDYDDANKVLIILTSEPMTISNQDSQIFTTYRIEVNLPDGDPNGANLTLNGVNIESTTGPAMKIEDGANYDVNITLADGTINRLKTGMASVYNPNLNYAGLQKNGGDGKLTIKGESAGTGQLTAIGAQGASAENDGGAGIGGAAGQSTSNIEIDGGIVTATSYDGAGIGGGGNGSGSNIKISGGTVTATAGGSGAGIGSGGGNGNVSESSGNVIEGAYAMVYATSGKDDKAALEGFGDGLKQGIVFTRQGKTASYEGNVYGEAILQEDMEVAENSKLTINEGANLNIGDGITLTNNGTLNVNGTITCTGTGKVITEVGYEPNGGEPAPASEKKTYWDKDGQKTYGTLPSGLTKTGYNLSGWYTKDDDQGSKVETTTNVDVNLHTLYAKWDINQYKVTFDLGDGSIYKTDTVNYQDKATRPDDPEKTGYTFTDWYDNQEGTGFAYDFDSPVTGDITLYAKWAINYYTVKFETATGTPAPEEQVVAYGEKVSLPEENPEREGYTFQYWSKDAHGINKWNFDEDTVSGDTTIYAYYLGDKQDVSISGSEHGQIIIKTPEDGRRTGNMILFEVIPDEGYQLKDMPQVNTVDGGNAIELKAGANDVIVIHPTGTQNEYSFVMPASAVTISADFEEIPEPTPEPTPDPSVDPDGDGGSGGASSKTSDPFMGGVALALLGVATAGAVLVHKRK